MSLEHYIKIVNPFKTNYIDILRNMKLLDKDDRSLPGGLNYSNIR
jgi:hypothetical protein